MQRDSIHYRRVDKRSNAELAQQWNSLALARDHQIRSGLDISFHGILMPEILKFLGDRRYRRILDAGCGTGVLTSFLESRAENVYGVDISGDSIDIAKRSLVSKNVKFFNTSIEEYALSMRSKYDAVVANMVLMDVSDLRKVLNSIYNLLKPGGVFIFSMTNPLFWAEYYGYSREPWFDYNSEIFIEGPFIISADRRYPDRISIGRSTHVHRPISMYINGFSDANFLRIRFNEPMPSKEVQQLYPKPWGGPRYIVGKAVAGPKIRIV